VRGRGGRPKAQVALSFQVGISVAPTVSFVAIELRATMGVSLLNSRFSSAAGR